MISNIISYYYCEHMIITPSGGREFQSVYTDPCSNIDLRPSKNTINEGLYLFPANFSEPFQSPRHPTSSAACPPTLAGRRVWVSHGESGLWGAGTAAWQKAHRACLLYSSRFISYLGWGF